MHLNQVTVGCTDYSASVAFYEGLGLCQIVDAPPRYARFETPGGETFSIHHVEHVSSAGTIVYFEIEALDDKVHELKRTGYTFLGDPKDEEWGWREARLRDPAGNEVCLFWGGNYRRFPPWRMDGKTKD